MAAGRVIGGSDASHQLMLSQGPACTAVFCNRCGKVTENQFRNLRKPCPGRPLATAYSDRWRLRTLQNGGLPHRPQVTGQRVWRVALPPAPPPAEDLAAHVAGARAAAAADRAVTLGAPPGSFPEAAAAAPSAASSAASSAGSGRGAAGGLQEAAAAVPGTAAAAPDPACTAQPLGEAATPQLLDEEIWGYAGQELEPWAEEPAIDEAPEWELVDIMAWQGDLGMNQSMLSCAVQVFI